MRLLLVGILLAWPTLAHADKRLDELRVGYEKETAGCKRSAEGVRKVAEGATELAKSEPSPELTADVEKLTAGSTIVKAYCDEIDGAIEAITKDPAATYRKLEHELDERDNRIRRGRAASKKVLAELEPISHRLIPRINAARIAGPPPSTDAKRTPVKFPSGHTVELPQLPGTWKVSGTTAIDLADYTEKGVVAFVSTRAFAKATCEQQRRIAAGDATPSELEVSTDDKKRGVAWAIGFTRSDHAVKVACATKGDGGFMATADVAPAQSKLADELARLMFRMLAVQLDGH
jgi:hypothetical protein